MKSLLLLSAVVLHCTYLSLMAGCEAGDRIHTTSPTDSATDTDSHTTDTDDTDTDIPTTCEPGALDCQGESVVRCNATGNGWDSEEDCAAQTLRCAAGKCADVSEACAAAMNKRSYVGCEYWAATFTNSSLNQDGYGNLLPGEPFFFALAIANNGDEDAAVHITDGPMGSLDHDYNVPGGEMILVEDLPWKKDLKDSKNTQGVFASRKVSAGAYHVTSSSPITVYQFSPLDYTVNKQFSYTNDASLLLPAHVYKDEYMAVTRASLTMETSTGQRYNAPGFVAIVGPQDGPTTLEITSSAYTLASDSKSNTPLGVLSPNQTVSNVLLAPFEVLQILSGASTTCPDRIACGNNFCCATPREYDLSGTIIKVIDGPPPAVFAGHDCTFVPYNKYACDHLEEQMFPLATWGTNYLCAHNITQKPAEPTVWRILSGSDNNSLTFEPSAVHSAATLNKGDFLEFESLADFQVNGTGRLAVAQFMVGQNYTSDTSPPPNGDPAMALAVPVEQYRTTYTFLAPTSYVHNYLTVIHKQGSFPSLDGLSIAGDTVDIAGGYSRTNLEIAGGIHDIESPNPFGIMVYGVGNYTSYMYPGGLDLKDVVVY